MLFWLGKARRTIVHSLELTLTGTPAPATLHGVSVAILVFVQGARNALSSAAREVCSMREVDVSRLLARAIGSPTFEREVLELTCRACTSEKAVLMRHQPPEEGGINGALLCAPYMSAADIERYHREFAQINPYATHMASMLPGRAQSTDDVMSLREYRKHPYFSWAERTYGAYELGGVVGHDGQNVLTITTCRRLRQGTFSIQQRAMMQRLMLALRPAWFTHRRLRAIEGIDTQDARNLVHMALEHYACFALDERGTLLECNATADSLLMHDDVVSRRDGAIRFANARAQARLLAILRGESHENIVPLDTAQGHAAIATLVRTPRAGIAAVRRMHGTLTQTGLHEAPAHWLLFVPATVAVRTQLRISNFAALHALSASERELVARLVSGKTLETIAHDLRQPLETCRSRLKQVLRKSKCSRQAELVIRVLA